MMRNKSLKFFDGIKFVLGIRNAFAFALTLSLFFWAVTLVSNDYAFKNNLFTSGSDDLEYLNASIQAVNDISQSTFGDLIDSYFYFSLHSLAYPVILYSFFSLTFATLFTGIFLNGLVLWLAIRIATLMPAFQRKRSYKFLTVLLLCPGLVLVSLHLYKDIFLLALILVSIVSFKNRNFVLAFIFAFLTHYFRPFNWILLFITFVAVSRPKIIVYALMAAGLALSFNTELFDFDNLYSHIQLAQSIALRDMQSYGSTYEPTNNFFLDYLIGLFRFTFLPFPFSINWTSRPFIFSLLDFLQSVVIYSAFFMSVCCPRRAIESIKNNSAIFIYTFLQVSTYSVIYFGNGDSRYRIFIYLCSALLIIDLSRRLGINGRWSRNIFTDHKIESFNTN